MANETRAAQHTPGPWWVGTKRRTTVFVGDSKGEHHLVVTAEPEERRSETKRFKSKEMLANVQLISAAPEMAEALAAMLRAWDRFVGKPLMTTSGAPSATDRAMAALKKAGVLR